MKQYGGHDDIPEGETIVTVFSPEELKEINKSLLAPLYFSLICSFACALVMYLLLSIVGFSDNTFGTVALGVLLMVIVLNITRLVSSHRSLTASAREMPHLEYVYTFCESSFTLQVYNRGTKTLEESKSYFDIQRAMALPHHLLLIVSGRYFIVRKCDLAGDSYLLRAVDFKIKKHIAASRRNKIVTLISIVALVVLLFIVIALQIYESYILSAMLTGGFICTL